MLASLAPQDDGLYQDHRKEIHDPRSTSALGRRGRSLVNCVQGKSDEIAFVAAHTRTRERRGFRRQGHAVRRQLCADLRRSGGRRRCWRRRAQPPCRADQPGGRRCRQARLCRPMTPSIWRAPRSPRPRAKPRDASAVGFTELDVSIRRSSRSANASLAGSARSSPWSASTTSTVVPRRRCAPTPTPRAP